MMRAAQIHRKEELFPAFVANTRYKGVWDMEDLYVSIADWFKKRKFKLYETNIKHKHPSPFGVERQYFWKAERFETDYVKIRIDLYMHTYDARDVEIVENNRKKIMTKGRIWIRITGAQEFDYEKSFEKGRFYAHLKHFYNRHIIKKEIDQRYWDFVWHREVMKLQAFVHEKLKVEAREYEHRYQTGVHT